MLDNRQAAEQSAAAGIADVVRRNPDLGSIDNAQIRDAMVGATLRCALDAHRDLREVDPLPEVARNASLAMLSPLQRAVAVGHSFGGVGLHILAAELSLPTGRVVAALAAAVSIVGGQEALASQLNEHQAGIPLSVSGEAVERAMSLPQVRRPHRLLAPAVAALALGLIGAAIGLRIWLPTNDGPAEGAVSAAPTTASAAPIAAAALPVDDLTLGDCKIQPASTELSFRGWLPLHDLVASPDPNLAAQPVYALVTRTTAEWVEWQTGEGRPMFPRPVGRLGCAIDPVGGKTTVYAIPDSWDPPELVDGCPSSAVRVHGSNREIGGPSAFVFLPGERRSWWSRDPRLEINMRIALSAGTSTDIRAMARPLGPGEAISFELRGLSTRPDEATSSNRYGTLSGVAFPTAGCWLLTISAGDQVIGSAVLPVTAPPALRPAD